MYIYLNGEFLKEEDAKISPFDHGYMYGLGVFETFRVYSGHPFLLDDHIKRLNHSVQELNISQSFSRENVWNIVSELLKLNQLTDAYVRFNVSAGIGQLGLQVNQYEHPTIIVYMKPLKLPGGMLEKEGVILTTIRNTPEGQQRLKSHHYLNNILAKREIGNDPSKEGIFLTEKGHLAEGIVSNLFWVKNNTLYTPSIQTGILNGITRQFILSLAAKLEIRFIEGYFTPDELFEADEVFVTNSIQELVPLNKIADKQFVGKGGKTVNQLQEIYHRVSRYLWSSFELAERNVLNDNSYSFKK